MMVMMNDGDGSDGDSDDSDMCIRSNHTDL